MLSIQEATLLNIFKGIQLSWRVYSIHFNQNMQFDFVFIIAEKSKYI